MLLSHVHQATGAEVESNPQKLISTNTQNVECPKTIKPTANKGTDTFSATFDRDYTVKENDLGTTFWVETNKFFEFEISNLMKK